jgi:hypothetical protein
MPATTPYTTIIIVVVIVVLLLLLGVCTVLQIANILRAKASRREGTEHQEIHTKENEAYGHFSGGGAAEAIGLTERPAGGDVEYEEMHPPYN